MRYTDSFIEKVRDANDIVEIIGEHVALKPAGKLLKGLCPFHNEKTPSFMVNPEKQFFHCYGCNVGGNVFHFLMKLQSLEFPKVVQLLAERARIPLPQSDFDTKQDASKDEKEQIFKANEFARNYFHQTLLNSESAENARKYFQEKRKISLEIMKQFHLGYATSSWDGLLQAALKKGITTQQLEKAGLILPNKSGTGYFDRFREQVIFPIVDVQGRVTGFGGRFLDNREPKYLNSPETPVFAKSRSLYALPQALTEIREQKFAILMEGYMDVLRAHQCDVSNAVATLGTALTQEQAKLLRRYCNDVVLMYDTDTAGIQAALRGLEPLVSTGLNVKVVTLPSGKDPDDFLQEKGKDDFYKEIGKAKTPVEFALDLTIKRYGLETVTAKANVVTAMFPLLDRIGQPVERELYLRIMAERVVLDKDVIFSQYRLRKKGKTAPAGTPVNQFESLLTGQVKAEQELLKILFARPSLSIPLKQKVGIEYFMEPVHRRIAETIFSLDENELANPSIPWLNHFTEESDIALVSQWLMEADELEKPDESFQGYLRKFEQQKVKRIQQELKEKMKQAVESGNQDLLRDLQEQFIQLQKSILSPAKASSS